MSEIVSNLHTLRRLLKSTKNKKSIGLVTGCFDLFHQGHIDLINFAKNSVDILIIGVDTDESVRKTKGKGRPVNNQLLRATELHKHGIIDYILLLKNKHSFKSKSADTYYDKLTRYIHPTHLITTNESDLYIENKKQRIHKLDGKLLVFQKKTDISTTKIIEHK